MFDKEFGKKAPQLLRDYSVAKYFDDDLFALLDDDVRPDFRWLLIGAAKSGSTFHKDPNNTSAFNAIISGQKKWILLPPQRRPPGVFCDSSESSVVVPLSLVEWFEQFYDATRRMNALEAVLKPGDVIYVPRSWWHLVLNLEEVNYTFYAQKNKTKHNKTKEHINDKQF